MNKYHSFKKNSEYKDSKKEICVHLKFGNKNKNTKVECYQVVNAILYRLKTGREIPIKQFFRTSYRWQSVYYHFNKWTIDGSWENLWSAVLRKYKNKLDMSSIQLDGRQNEVAKARHIKEGNEQRQQIC